MQFQLTLFSFLPLMGSLVGAMTIKPRETPQDSSTAYPTQPTVYPTQPTVFPTNPGSTNTAYSSTTDSYVSSVYSSNNYAPSDQSSAVGASNAYGPSDQSSYPPVGATATDATDPYNTQSSYEPTSTGNQYYPPSNPPNASSNPVKTCGRPGYKGTSDVAAGWTSSTQSYTSAASSYYPPQPTQPTSTESYYTQSTTTSSYVYSSQSSASNCGCTSALHANSPPTGGGSQEQSAPDP